MMNSSNFVYTIYIKSTAVKLWEAITYPEYTRQYWGYENISDWKKGSEWKHVSATDGQVMVIGKVLESNPPHRLVLSWAMADDQTDDSKAAFEIDIIQDMVQLTVTHSDFKVGSDMPVKWQSAGRVCFQA